MKLNAPSVQSAVAVLSGALVAGILAGAGELTIVNRAHGMGTMEMMEQLLASDFLSAMGS